MIAVYANVNRPALETEVFRASPRLRSAPARSFAISSRVGACGWRRLMRARFSIVIHDPDQWDARTAHHPLDEAGILRAGLEIGGTHDDGVHLAPKLVGDGVDGADHFLVARGPDDHQVHVATRPVFAASDRSEHEGAVDLRLERQQR